MKYLKSIINKSFLKIIFGLVFLFFSKIIFAQEKVKKNSFMVLPLIAKSIETSWSFGSAVSATFKSKDSTIRTSNAQGLALYSVNKQFIVALNGTIYFPKEKEILTSQISFSSFPDKFWGIGPNSKNEDEENYEFKQYYIDFHLQKKVANKLYIGGIFESQNVMKLTYKSGGLFDKENLPGKNGYIVSGMGLSLTYDSRNHAFAPTKGTFLQTSATIYNTTFGSDFAYTNYVFDVRKYFSINKKVVNASQLFLFINKGDKVPLRSLATFGGSNSMRGFYDGRFRDKNQFVFQNELRFDVYKRLGAVAFVGLGGVAHSTDKFALNELKYSIGGGLRYALNPSEKLNIRVDYGIGLNYSNGLYIQISEAF